MLDSKIIFVNDKARKVAIVTDIRQSGLSWGMLKPRLINEPSFVELLSERYSEATISIITECLTSRGFEVDVLRDCRKLVEYVKIGSSQLPYSAVVNLATGTFAPFRSGQSAILLDMLHVPYSGSDPQTLLVLRDKSLCKVIAKDTGVKTPGGILLSVNGKGASQKFQARNYPLILKPNFGCNSIGVNPKILAPNENHGDKIARMLQQFPEGVLVEEFIPGVEVTVYVVGQKTSGQIIPLILRRKNGDPLPDDYILTGKHKLLTSKIFDVSWELAHTVLPPKLISSLTDITWRLVDVFRIRDFARFDYKVQIDSEDVYFIECNGQPGLGGNAASITATINREWFKAPNKLQDMFVDAFLKRVFS